MTGATTKSFSTPDEQRSPPNTVVDVVHLGTHAVARFTFQPGWRWSTDVAPVAGTDSCQARHVGSVQSGTLHVTLMTAARSRPRRLRGRLTPHEPRSPAARPTATTRERQPH
jgi:hypothetical protein